MSNAHTLVARMTEVERTKVRRATPDGLVGMYHSYRAELSGGVLKGGTEEDGMAEMVEVGAMLNADYTEASKNPGFGLTWRF